MDSDRFIEVLGHRDGEPLVVEFLASHGISARPKVKRGDFTAHVSNKSRGVEVTFCIAEALDVPDPSQPEGALVLSNVNLYGRAVTGFTPFAGKLPLALTFGSLKSAVVQALGPPVHENEFTGALRWDRRGFCLFADFDEPGQLVGLTIQLPVA